jgi:hypothetical protein
MAFGADLNVLPKLIGSMFRALPAASTPHEGFEVQSNAINLRNGSIFVGTVSNRDYSVRSLRHSEFI